MYRLITIFFVCLFFIGLLAYIGLRIWRRQKLTEAMGGDVDFQPHIGFTKQDGWVSLALMLYNRSDIKVWAEEVIVVLTDLKANDQTAVASGQATHAIRQTVGPGDMLPISLVEVIYDAAGKPQRRYSCFLSASVNYQADDRWFQKNLQVQRIKMSGFKVRSAKPVRWYQTKVRPVNIPTKPRMPDHEEQSRSTRSTPGRPAN